VHSVSKHRCYPLEQYREIDRRIAITHETRCEIFVHASLIINKHEKFFLNKGKWEIGSGKQILRLACLKGKVEFKFLSSPDTTKKLQQVHKIE